MDNEKLLNMYDTVKDCKVSLRLVKGNDFAIVTIEDLFRMFEAVRERNDNAVSQD